MNWIALCVICLHIATLDAKHELNIRKLIQLIRRRNIMNSNIPIMGAPLYPEHLPKAEPILPGHTLLRPALGTLKSAVKFPLRDTGDTLVYGNKANVGLAYEKKWRVRYSDFRKALNNEILSALLRSIKKDDNVNAPLIVKIKNKNPKTTNKYKHQSSAIADSEEDAREILDMVDPTRDNFEENSQEFDFRRTKKSSKFRKRHYASIEGSSTDSDSENSSQEKNPGNPYTVHKDKYINNWMWNYVMDGNHVNINPYAPTFHNSAPPGTQLFFGRKWWYFNQDDYKPMG